MDATITPAGVLGMRLGGLTIRDAIVRTWREDESNRRILTRAAAITFYGMAAAVPFMGLVIVLLAQGLPISRERSPAT